MPYIVPEWSKSPPDATAPAFLSSYNKALEAKLTPIPGTLDAENGYAEFSGSGGYYRVSLYDCPCGSKTRPCKHMYRLAMELGIMPGSFASDASKVKWKRTGVPLPDTVARVETVSEEAQRALLDLLPELRKGPIEITRLSAALTSELDEARLVVRIDQPVELRLHPDVDKSSYGLIKYLRRKFGTAIHIIGDGEIELPDSASLLYKKNGEPLFFVCPDDEITALLLQYGHDRLAELNGVPTSEILNALRKLNK